MELDSSWPDGVPVDLRERLKRRYRDPARGYHDLLHLREVLERVDVLLAADTGILDRDALVLAAWYHDAVYDTLGDNEERSAALAESELAGSGVRPETVAEVARLVRLTATHRADASDRSGQVLCDADLGILAADDDRYRGYAAGVRREYAAVPEAEFRAGRAAVLRDLAGRDALFGTDHARREWEQAARANLDRELRELT